MNNRQNQQNGNADPERMNQLLQMLAQRMGIPKENLENSLNSGKLGELTKNMRQEDLEKFQAIMNNPMLAKQMLNSKQAQDILRNLKK